MVPAGTVVETAIPARLDRLPWSGWHWRVVIALGITWVLDGLEATLAGSVAGVLGDRRTLGLGSAQIGLAATLYLLGAVIGALGFGWLTDRLGRKKLFFVTLALYLVATAASATAWSFWSFAFFRFFTGAGIGGEYAAINSAIDELIPARRRGQVDLVVNGSYWVGAALGALGSLVLLDPQRFPVNFGWRLAFGIGAVMGLCILFMRRHLPESPRWLVIHGRMGEADRTVAGIERAVEASSGQALPAPEGKPLRLRTRRSTPLSAVFHSMLREHPRRTVLGLSLMIAQAFFYNAIFFTYALILVRFYRVAPDDVGLYLLPFAVSNALGPILLGHLFDSIGRKVMIAATYTISGLMLAATGYLFLEGRLDAWTQTLAWTAIFFVASPAASAAYLTVSETFPLEVRALAIAVFYALGTLVGGVGAPWLFGRLIEAGTRGPLFWGYVAGGVVMLAAAGVALVFGVDAERKSLEDIASPLSKA